jgi:two-component system alkaline phosphatase synthesis response regulator PhoP
MDHLDGVALLEEAKQRYPDLAVILLTGHATVASAIAALRQGAHNYLLKPVKNEDILAAVAEALEERSRQQRRDHLESLANQMLEVVQVEPSALSGSVRSVAYGGIVLDSVTYTSTLHGNRLDLTPTEFRLLLKLCQTPEASFDYVTLVQAACGYICSRQEAQEIISTHVRNLRQKLDEPSSSSVQIESVRGIGYRLVSNIIRDTTS